MRSRIGDDRAQAAAFEQALKQQELRVRVLIRGRQVDDGNGLERARRLGQCCIASSAARRLRWYDV